MDTDWCLNCNRRTDSFNAYCSDECRIWAGPSYPVHSPHIFRPPSPWSFVTDEDASVHTTPYVGHSRAAIRAWASMVPQCPSSSKLTNDNASLSAISSTSSFRPPKLLRRQRPVSPTLCMSTLTPTTPSTSKPALSQIQKIALILKPVSSARSVDTSFSSTMSESPIATPSTRAGSILEQKSMRASGLTFSNDSKEEKRSAHDVLFKPPSYTDCLHIHIIPSS